MAGKYSQLPRSRLIASGSPPSRARSVGAAEYSRFLTVSTSVRTWRPSPSTTRTPGWYIAAPGIASRAARTVAT